MMIQFPKGFVWGSSTSGPQTEGRISGDGRETIFGTIGLAKKPIVSIMKLDLVRHPLFTKIGSKTSTF